MMIQLHQAIQQSVSNTHTSTPLSDKSSNTQTCITLSDNATDNDEEGLMQLLDRHIKELEDYRAKQEAKKGKVVALYNSPSAFS